MRVYLDTAKAHETATTLGATAARLRSVRGALVGDIKVIMPPSAAAHVAAELSRLGLGLTAISGHYEDQGVALHKRANMMEVAGGAAPNLAWLFASPTAFLRGTGILPNLDPWRIPFDKFKTAGSAVEKGLKWTERGLAASGRWFRGEASRAGRLLRSAATDPELRSWAGKNLKRLAHTAKRFEGAAARVGKVGKVVGRRVPIIGSAIEFSFDIIEGDSTGRALARTLGSAGGGALGAVVGGAIGSVVPGPGTAIGAVIGAAAGSWLGSCAAGAIYDGVNDQSHPQQAALQPVPASGQGGW